MIQLVPLAALAALLWLIGAGALSLLQGSDRRRIGRCEILILAGPLGACIVCWLLFVALELHVLRFSSSLTQWAVVLPAVILGGIFVGRLSMRPDSGRSRIVARWIDLTWWAKLCTLLLLAFLAGKALGAVSDPLTAWDGRMYRLPYAHVVFQTGTLPAFSSPSYNDCFSYPPLPMLIYALGWGWLGEVHMLLPKLLPFVFAAGALAWVYLLARRAMNLSRDLSVLAVLFCAVLVPVRWINENTDAVLAFWSLAALYFTLRPELGRRWLAAGICLGMAVMTKHHGLIFAAAILPLFFFSKEPWSRRIANALAAFVLCMLVAAPWMIRNWMLWDNPIYPAAMPVLGGYLYDQWTAQYVLPFWQQPHIFHRALHAIFNIVRGAWLIPLAAVFFIFRSQSGATRQAAAVWFFLALSMALYVMLGVVPQGSGLRLFAAAPFAACCLLALMVRGINARKRPDIAVIVTAGALIVTAMVLTRDMVLGILSEQGIIGRDGSRLGCFEILTTYQWPVLALVLWIVWFVKSRGGRAPAAVFAPGTAMAVALLILGWPHLLAAPVKSVSFIEKARQVDWRHSEPWKPYGNWVDRNLPEDAVLLTFNDQRWVIPRTLVGADNPLLKRVYEDNASIDEILLVLAQIGVTHVIYNDVFQAQHDLGSIGPLWQIIEKQENFTKIFYNEHTVEHNRERVAIYRIEYPQHLLPILNQCSPGPWLYAGATVGPLDYDQE